ncbi:MAG: FKBP-type peptidyl-prolyl cis-trans isomerase [Bacteroidales bacterium]|nr:FKBP-type peptidyl-prolyl cis-trans isomerase [Bacteroidales bacterium]
MRSHTSHNNHYLPHLLLLLAGVISIWGCGDPPIIETETDNVKSRFKESGINANRYLIEHEETNINAFVERRGWQVRLLPCGARIHEYVVGQGRRILNDDSVTIRCTVSTLSGIQIYCDTVQSFITGRLQPNEGLDAAILELHYGSRAHVLLPSHVAYGVIGDGNGIPPRTPLVYSLEVLSPNQALILNRD